MTLAFLPDVADSNRAKQVKALQRRATSVITGADSPIDRKIKQDMLSRVESPRLFKSKPKTDVEVSYEKEVKSV